MPRKRMIDPEFWNDEEIGAWSTEARLFYIGLWNFADDEGRLRAHPKLLRSQIFPYDEKLNIEKLKGEVAKKILWYTADGQEYGFIKNFLKHQRIDRPGKSQIPPPSKDVLEAFLNNREQLDEDSTIPRRPLAPKLREVKLREEKLNTAPTSRGSEPPERAAKIVFNHSTNSWEGVSAEDMKAWAEAYPACDLKTEFAKMREWILANPAKGRKQNWRRFISNWLSRAQDRGGTFPGNGRGERPVSKIGGSNKPPDTAYWAAYRKKQDELRASGLDEEAVKLKMAEWTRERHGG